MSRKRLGELLIEAGLVDALKLAVALGDQKQWGGKLGATLIQKGFISASDLAHVLAKQLHIDWISLRDREIPEEVLSLMDVKVAKRHKAIPVEAGNRSLTVAMANPTDLKAVDDIAFVTGKHIKPVMAVEAEIMLAIARHYDKVWVDEQRFDSSYLAQTLEGNPVTVDGKPLKATPPARAGDIVSSQKLEALIRLLTRKGLITEQELMGELQGERPDTEEDSRN